jgi:hypothetical protein
MNNVFISGEKIDLCVPQEEDFDQWASWFNDQAITKFLVHGKYPNTVDQQRTFYRKAIESGRFIALIKTKDKSLLGVISLSEINFEKQSSQIALVCPVKSKQAIYAPLEAMALCTQHAIKRIGVTYIWAGQAYPGLLKWVKNLELIGYKTDGVFPREFKHGLTVSDAIRTSITKDRFLSLTIQRSGNLWPGEEKVKRMISANRLNKSLAEQIDESIKNLHARHDRMMDRIEIDAQ